MDKFDTAEYLGKEMREIQRTTCGGFDQKIEALVKGLRKAGLSDLATLVEWSWV